MLTYYPGKTFLHRLDPTLKVLFAFTISTACFVFANIFVLLGILLFEFLLALSCGLWKWGLRSILGLLKLCALLFVIQILTYGDGDVLLRLYGDWVITFEGAEIGLILTLRITASALPLALMLRVTKPTALANSLYRYLHIPYKYAFAFGMAMRFIPIFAEEMAEIMEAQTARGVELDTRSFFKKIRLLMPLCVPLLLSSVRKIETATISAELRGFGLRKRK
ncbi:MAG: energy-coupling factor transporter transmembrane protein EcfT [Oscillospiraceae bacterium]|jgi:energy-coupling factor transport system permease protein|nr:energy-coupling factor transporter transmembrane protein EcfT [Oscillospiraceae bacterium]